MQNYQSWGGYPKTQPKNIHPIYWRSHAFPDIDHDTPVLPYAYGRSYGDSCQNHEGDLLATQGLRRFISFNEHNGVLRCEGGVSLAEILDCFVPRGWFLPVSPGTKYVSVGGAMANDVHGKNHHKAGTFGCHVLAFELLRSNGERLTCSPQCHSDLFQATIGGLGLTGLIVWADIQLKSIKSPFIQTERIKFSGLDEFFDLTNQSDESFEYTVAWIDCFAKNRHTGRGSFIRGNHLEEDSPHLPLPLVKKPFTIPVQVPSCLLRSGTMKIFNWVYYQMQPSQLAQSLEPYEKFFYPLDVVLNWNRLYGTSGFLQYQCVIPCQYERDGIRDLLKVIHQSKQGSFLAVLKKFGSISSPGLLSFPRPGTTLALDFPFFEDETLRLLTKLDRIVRETGGAVYPAKDARMSAEDFQTYFPRWEEFTKFKDQKFSSSFWRRVAPLKNSIPRPTRSLAPRKMTHKEHSLAGHKSFYRTQHQ